MIGLIRAELVKLGKRRLFWIMSLILVLFTTLTAWLFLALPALLPAGQSMAFPVIPKPLAYSFGAAQVVGQTWFPVILAVVLLAGETGTSVWAASLTLESRRWMHLLAKFVVYSLAAWLAAVLAVGAWSAVTAAVATGSGSPSVGEWLAMLGKTGVIQMTWIGIGLGFAAMLRSLGAAIGAGLAFTVGEGILALWQSWENVSLGIASGRFFGRFGEVNAGFGFAAVGEMPFAQAVVVVLGWAALGAAAAVVGLHYRDP
ncbi:MAG TPA: hypothetical protein VIY70_01440 [Acidimicrobiia bacterium]